MRSLCAEISTSSELLQSVLTLSELAYTIFTCDAGLSDLLEHLDSFPSLPVAALASTHVSDPTIPPEEQLQVRVDFTKQLVEDVEAKANSVAWDGRASGERERIQQAWGELEAMSEDILDGVKSRPPSTISTGSVSGPTASRLHQPPRPHVRSGTVGSPTPGEVSSLSRSHLGHSTVARPSWDRAPRQPLPFDNRATTPGKSRAREPRKPYVADPKNRLDVAVGAVVNKLPISVNINVEAVADTLKDNSGKYWIGDHDPKLCFLRILHSRTVMVRVGGGWQELSK